MWIRVYVYVDSQCFLSGIWADEEEVCPLCNQRFSALAWNRESLYYLHHPSLCKRPFPSRQFQATVQFSGFESRVAQQGIRLCRVRRGRGSRGRDRDRGRARLAV